MILLENIIHTVSTYSNRWGGPRFNTIELYKFMNKHLSGKQDKEIANGDKVNTILISDAFLSSKHMPLYLKSLQYKEEKETYFIKDELGFETEFPKGTEILIWNEDCKTPEYIKIENIKEGINRVINFE